MPDRRARRQRCWPRRDDPQTPGILRGGAVSADVDLTGVLRPVREGNAFEETVERLLTVIKLGVVGTGDRLPPERELAAQLGISRLTLREAIRELSTAGFVQSRRGRLGGTFVTYTRPAPNVGDLRKLAQERGDKLTDAVTFRYAVETGAAELLAQQFATRQFATQRFATQHFGAPAEDLTARREALLGRLADVSGASPADYRRMDTLFHLAIAELTGSSMLSAACAQARLQLNDLLNAIPVLKRNIANAAAQHEEIVKAILAGDPARARTAAAEHLEGTASLLRGFLG